MIDKAVSLAMADRPGPVHLDVPIGVAAQQHPAEPPMSRTRTVAAAPAPGPDLEAARAWLAGAERPLIIAGLDAVLHDAGDPVVSLARTLGAPVIASYKAKACWRTTIR